MFMRVSHKRYANAGCCVMCPENESNTPDFLLADYLMRCLQTWEAVTRRRDEWYGDRKWPNIVWPTTRKEPQHENEG